MKSSKTVRRNPDTLRTIVLANLDPVGETEWYEVRGRREHRPAPLVQALVWVNAGDAEDEKKARAYAKKEGYEVFIFPTSEADPLGKAKRELLATWKAAQEAAKAKAAVRARRRKVVNPAARKGLSLKAFHAATERLVAGGKYANAAIKPGVSAYMKLPSQEIVLVKVRRVYGPVKPRDYLEGVQRRAIVSYGGQEYDWPTMDLVVTPRVKANPRPLRRNPAKGSADFFTSPSRDDMRYMVIAHQDAADRFAKDGRHRHDYIQKTVVEAHEKAAKAWAKASDFGLSKKAAKAALSEAEERSEIAEKCENESRQRFSEQERMKALLKQAKSNPRRKNPSGAITAALNVPQKTNRGVIIEWTARLPGLHQETLSGHVIGRRGKPLAGFVLAPLFRDGRIGVIHDQRGGIVG